MSNSTMFISPAAVRNLKNLVKQKVPNVKSSHLTECVAASLGFKSNAALRERFRNVDTFEVSKPDNKALVNRLTDLGYNLLHDTNSLIPEFKSSYGPFKNFPLRSRFGPRWHAWRNILVAGINAGLEQKQFGLSPRENWWSGASQTTQYSTRGMYHFLFDNNTPAIATVNVVEGDELSILVLINPKQNTFDEIPCFGGLQMADASALCYLERYHGAWIQCGNIELSCKCSLLSDYASLKIPTIGYSDQGSFIM